jgi:hypothetical protein
MIADGATPCLYALRDAQGNPTDTNSLDLPPPRMSRRTRAYANESLRAVRAPTARKYRERAAQQDAMDAPFAEMARERFFGPEGFVSGAVHAASAASGGQGEANAELDPYKTKGAKLREVLEIDVYSSRVRKLQKAVRNSAHILDSAAHVDEQGVRWRRLFVTLTYAEDGAWKPGHVGDFRRGVRDWFKRSCQGTRMRMVWVMELTKRGRPHYHCMIWVRARDYFPNPHKAGWWPHGFAHVLSSKVHINRPVAYMAKYASKFTAEQAKHVPKGARLYGVCGATEEGKRVIRWWRAPIFTRDHFGGAADIRKVAGGYLNRVTGEFLVSEWKVTITPAGRVFAWRDIPPITETIQ